MQERKKLFGISIRPDCGVSSVDQIYGILCHEIHSGRWHPGDKLSTIPDLSEESGLSTWIIHKAFTKLQEEGYTRSRGRSGTELISTYPRKSAEIGSIGVAVFRPTSSHPLNTTISRSVTNKLPLIFEVAAKRNLNIEVRYLSENDDWNEVDTIGRYFSEKIKGIISLHEFTHSHDFEIPEGKLPFVYWGENSIFCLPLIAINHYSSYYRMTKHIIEKNHSHIILLQNPERTTYIRESILGGHEHAMRECGLDVNHEVAERSLSLKLGHLPDLQEFISKYLNKATVILNSWYKLVEDIVLVASMMGIKLPEELSIAGAAPRECKRHDGSILEMTTFDHTPERICNECFGLLIEQIRTRRCSKSHILMMARIVKGNSLSAPRQAPLESVKVHEKTEQVN